MLKSILPCLLFVCFLATANSAGELQLLMSSKINVDDINDHQFQDCDTYLFQKELLFDNPNQLALFQNQAYRLGFEFTAFINNNQLTANDIGESGIRVDVSPREKSTYKIRAVSQSGGKVMIDLNIYGEIEDTDTLRVQLWGNNSEVIAEAIFPFQVYDASGDFSGMAVVPFMLQVEPAYVILSDANNPNNFIQREAGMGGEPILLKKSKEYKFEFELEKHVNIDGQEYVVIVDENNQYGYHIRYSWDQPLDFKNQNNGFSGTLITKKDGRTRPNIPLWVNGDMTSLMPDKGKRTVQYLKFYQNDPNQNKVYADLRNQNLRVINQRKRLASVANARYITNFQETDIKNIEKISPKSANLKVELLKGSSFVVVEPEKNILQMDKIKTQYFLENNGNIKPQLMVPMQRMQMVTPPQNKVDSGNKNIRYQRSTSKAKANSSATISKAEINRDALKKVKPKAQEQQYSIANGSFQDRTTGASIHTLYIEACTDTDYLNCRPFQIQIKLVD